VLRVAVRLVADALLVALCLFISAGTLAWWRAWVLLIVLVVVRGIGTSVVHPVNAALLRERAKLPLHPEQPQGDRLLLLAVLATGFLGIPVVAGLDVFKWHLLQVPHPVVSAGGLVMFSLGWSLKSLALRANAFATAAVRLQRERSHVVADSGVYAVIRHPFYAADPLILVGLALWLESYAAALCALIPIALVLIRLQLEERFLRRELPGYVEYTVRVRHRLVPKIW
jgi:protein-S-isoprenylcysteine O-methyltransferase Ste14